MRPFYNIAQAGVLFLNQKVLIYFFYLHKDVCCEYSFEVPQWGTSYEYPQHTFLWLNKNIKTFWLEKSASIGA